MRNPLLWAGLVSLVFIVGCSGSDDEEDDGPDPSAGDGESARMEGMTYAHNLERHAADPDMPDLTWDADIAAVAQTYAEKLASSGCNLTHSRGPYGENIFWASGSAVTPERVVDSWASEKVDYNYASNSCSGICGHYTQIVWADSLRLGCGAADCPDGSEMWICNYDPPGNYNNQSPY